MQISLPPCTSKTKVGSGPKLYTCVGHDTGMKMYYHFGPTNEGQGPQGPILKIQRACFFLATKAATWLWFGMVIGIDHPHTNNSNYATYFEVYGPQGPILKYKGPAFS